MKDDATFVVGVVADLSRDARAPQRRGAVDAFRTLRGPKDVDALRSTIGAQGAPEHTWRALRHLAESCGDGARPVVVRVLDVATGALRRDLEGRTPEASQVRARFRDAARETPFGLLVLDDTVVGQTDAPRLAAFVELAAALHAPLLASASPELLDLDDFGGVTEMRPDRVEYRLWRVERVRLKVLRSTPEARFVWLLLPRVRLPLGTLVDPAYALAAHVARLARETGGFRAPAGWERDAFPDGAEVRVPPPTADALRRERIAVVPPEGAGLPSLFLAGEREPTLQLSLPELLRVTDVVHEIERRWFRLAPAESVSAWRIETNAWLAAWVAADARFGGAEVSVNVDATRGDGALVKLTVSAADPDVPGGAQFVTRFLPPDRMTRLPADLAAVSTADLVRLEAEGHFPLGESWGDALFYAEAHAPPGGVGARVLALVGTAPLKLDVFHRPPASGDRPYGAADMTGGPLRRDDLVVAWDPPSTLHTPGTAEPPNVLLVAARARLVRTSTVNTSLPPSLVHSRRQEHWKVELDGAAEVRALWVYVGP